MSAAAGTPGAGAAPMLEVRNVSKGFFLRTVNELLRCGTSAWA